MPESTAKQGDFAPVKNMSRRNMDDFYQENEWRRSDAPRAMVYSLLEPVGSANLL